MVGPLTDGRAGWINPFGFFIVPRISSRLDVHFLHFLTGHGFGGSGSWGFWGCGLRIFRNAVENTFLFSRLGFTKNCGGKRGFLTRF